METMYYMAAIGLLIIMTKRNYVHTKPVHVGGITFRVRITGYILLFGLYNKATKVEIISSNLTVNVEL